MDKLTGMKVFVTASRLGTFSAAAEELGISRAMASKHMNALESDLGIRLINRTTRHLSLTEGGEIFREKIATILQEIEEAEQAAASLQNEPRGQLRVMAPPSFGSFHLARLVYEYSCRYPEVMIDMVLSNRPADLFEDGVDLAICLGEQDDSTLIAKRLTTTRIVVCGAPDYFRRFGRPEKPSDLQHHNCLTLSQRSIFTSWKFRIEDQSVSLNLRGNFRANTSDPLRIAAIQGSGLIQLPTYLVGLDLQHKRLEAVLQDYEPEALPIYATYVHRKYLSAKVRTFVDFLHQQFQPKPYWENWF